MVYRVIASLKLFTAKDGEDHYIYFLRDACRRLKYIESNSEKVFVELFGQDYDLGDSFETYMKFERFGIRRFFQIICQLFQRIHSID